MNVDQIITDTQKVVAVLGPHWPFLVYTFTFAFIGEVMKKYVLSPTSTPKLQKEADRYWNKGGFWYVPAIVLVSWLRVPLPLHPLAAGIILGLIPGVPVSAGVVYGIQSVLYCMSAGMLSTALYSTIRAVFTFVWLHVLRKPEPVPYFQLPGDPDGGNT